MNAANERALITGASSGIGLELAREFARQGHSLVITATDQVKLQALAATLQQEFKVQVTPTAKDLTQPDAAQELFDELNEAGLDIHVLVNDAGIGQRGKFFETPLDREVAMVRLNVEAVVRMTKLFLKPMVLRNNGKILNVASVAGFEPGPLLAVYHASKAFVLSFSQALAIELEETAVTVTALCPGATETAFFDKADMNDTRLVHTITMAKPQDVAVAAYKALRRGDSVYVHGALNKVLVAARRILPTSTHSRLNQAIYQSVKPGEQRPKRRAKAKAQPARRATVRSAARFNDVREIPRSARRHAGKTKDLATEEPGENS